MIYHSPLLLSSPLLTGHLMIVSSLLPRGNVQDVLLDKERYPALSLLQRMKMARDTALGMNWYEAHSHVPYMRHLFSVPPLTVVFFCACFRKQLPTILFHFSLLLPSSSFSLPLLPSIPSSLLSQVALLSTCCHSP